LETASPDTGHFAAAVSAARRGEQIAIAAAAENAKISRNITVLLRKV
jgi:hypothetical protein